VHHGNAYYQSVGDVVSKRSDVYDGGRNFEPQQYDGSLVEQHAHPSAPPYEHDYQAPPPPPPPAYSWSDEERCSCGAHRRGSC